MFTPNSHNTALTLPLGTPIMNDDIGLFLQDGPCQADVAQFIVNKQGLIEGFIIDNKSAHLQTVKNVFKSIIASKKRA